MRVRAYNRVTTAQVRSERPTPPGAGILIAGAASVLMWGMIVGVATIF